MSPPTLVLHMAVSIPLLFAPQRSRRGIYAASSTITSNAKRANSLSAGSAGPRAWVPAIALRHD